MSQDTEVSSFTRDEAVATQEACVAISALTSKLPSKEGKIINDAIDLVRARLKSDLEAQAKSLFVWDKLPGEVKNTIYKLLLVSDEPIEPFVRYPTSRTKREWYKHSLSGQVLRLSKTVYQEALPILLGDNTFVLNKSFDKYLGYGLDQTVEALSNGVGTAPSARAAMVRMLIIDDQSVVSASQMTTLRRLTGLEELLFIHRPSGNQPLSRIDTDSWEEVCGRKPRAIVDPRLALHADRTPGLTCHFIAYETFYDERPFGRDIFDPLVSAYRKPVEFVLTCASSLSLAAGFLCTPYKSTNGSSKWKRSRWWTGSCLFSRNAGIVAKVTG